MTKKEIIERVSELSGSNPKSVQSVLASYQSVILETLKAEKEVPVLDIGRMKVVHKKQRNGINPQTGKTITVPERDAPKLAFSKKIKSFVDGADGVKITDFKF